MVQTAEQIESNLAQVRERIARAASRGGRQAEQVRLVAVTKTVGLEEVRILHTLGVREFGENRIEPSREKIKTMGEPVVWHMIGSLQRRKAKEAVQLFPWIDSIDRIELAQAIEGRCQELGKTVSGLIEVNVSGESTKHGFTPEQLAVAMKSLKELKNIEIRGLMTMAPFVEDPEEVRPVFAGLRELAQRFELPELSMGMTNDFEVAIEEGATQVRIGSALFQ